MLSEPMKVFSVNSISDVCHHPHHDGYMESNWGIVNLGEVRRV